MKFLRRNKRVEMAKTQLTNEFLFQLLTVNMVYVSEKKMFEKVNQTTTERNKNNLFVFLFCPAKIHTFVEIYRNYYTMIFADICFKL